MTDNMPRAVAGRRETKSIVFVLSLFIDSRLVKLLSSAGCCQTSVPNSKNLCSSELASPDYQKEEKSIFLFVCPARRADSAARAGHILSLNPAAGCEQQKRTNAELGGQKATEISRS